MWNSTETPPKTKGVYWVHEGGDIYRAHWTGKIWRDTEPTPDSSINWPGGGSGSGTVLVFKPKSRKQVHPSHWANPVDILPI